LKGAQGATQIAKGGAEGECTPRLTSPCELEKLKTTLWAFLQSPAGGNAGRREGIDESGGVHVKTAQVQRRRGSGSVDPARGPTQPVPKNLLLIEARRPVGERRSRATGQRGKKWGTPSQYRRRKTVDLKLSGERLR